MEYGWVMLIVLAVMGGIIAYLGDKIGSRVGKRKIKLFGLRPKYTSILITILTGVSIAAMTLGVMSILSENVRIALFGMHQLQMQKAQLESQRDQLLAQAKDLGKELDDKNAQIEANENMLKQQQEQLDGKNKEIRTTQLDLQQAQAARDDKARQLTVIQVAMDEAEKQRDSALADSEKARQDVAALEETKNNMMDAIAGLDRRIKLLNATMTNVREGVVIFRAGEVLSSTVLNGGLDQTQTREEISEAMNQTNRMICRHLGIQDDKAVLLYISPDEFNAAAEALQKAGKSAKLMRIIAAGNIVLGEPTPVHLEMYDNNLVYKRGTVVYEETVNSSSSSGNDELVVMRFLHNVNQQAQAQGLLPDPLTGNVGALTATEMFDTITQMKNHSAGGRNVVLKAVAETDTYTAGPLQIDIRVEETE